MCGHGHFGVRRILSTAVRGRPQTCSVSLPDVSHSRAISPKILIVYIIIPWCTGTTTQGRGCLWLERGFATNSLFRVTRYCCYSSSKQNQYSQHCCVIMTSLGRVHVRVQASKAEQNLRPPRPSSDAQKTCVRTSLIESQSAWRDTIASFVLIVVRRVTVCISQSFSGRWCRQALDEARQANDSQYEWTGPGNGLTVEQARWQRISRVETDDDKTETYVLIASSLVADTHIRVTRTWSTGR